MSPESRPTAIPLEPGSSALPPALESAIAGSTSSILLLVVPDAGDDAIRAAVQIAEARARAGEQIVLADAGAADPRLHGVLGVDNLEGLADVFLFGASLDRVRTRPADRSFDFVPVGAYVPDPSAVLESSRWDGIEFALRSKGERLLLFVPADSPGLGILSGRVGEAILIGDARSVVRSWNRLAPSCEVLSVVEPAPLTGLDETAPGPDEGDGVEEGGLFTEPALTEPVVFRSDRRGQRAVTPVLLLLFVAALLAAGWFAYQTYFATAAPEPATQPATVAPTPVERGEPVETPIPISVAVEAHQDLASAQDRVRTLRQAEPDLHFFLAPVAVRDVLYYRLLSGPVMDREAGERLMARLVERGHKTASDPWAIRPTEQAFLLGEYDEAEAARAMLDSLATLDIPSYIVPIRYDPGPRRYRVYGGAYESDAEASVMREMLREAGVEGRLVPRTGEPIEGS